MIANFSMLIFNKFSRPTQRVGKYFQNIPEILFCKQGNETILQFNFINLKIKNNFFITKISFKNFKFFYFDHYIF
jgi:hypothetical protein